MASLNDELERKGYLSVHQLALFLEEHYPIKAASYPTILRMVKTGKIRGEHVGSGWRVPKEEILHYLEHGAREVGKGGLFGASQLFIGER